MMKKWLIKTTDTSACNALSRTLGISAVTAQVMINRGIVTEEEGRKFLTPSLSAMPDPLLLKDMANAVQRLIAARNGHEPVCVYGDYDVDGITGTALLVSFLRHIGMECRYYIPNRFDDGYGLNSESLQLIIDTGVRLILSVDCGITSVAEAEYCRQRGVDLIILDHHTPASVIPDATAVVNPVQPDCSYPFKLLAGVGVAFNLLVALRSSLRQAGIFEAGQEPDLRDWLDLVALGTIADVVPLSGVNRVFVHYGLQRLEMSTRPGIIALKQVAGIRGAVSCGQVGFRMAPRLNAAGRMESAVPGVELLLNRDGAECSRIAGELDAANAERQSVEKSILDQAVSMVEAGPYPSCNSIVLSSNEWHQGVIGIVASRLAERYYRPVILLAVDDDGNAKGSGRSIPEFHLLHSLKLCERFLERYGGHKYAAGVGLRSERIEEFAEAFEAAAGVVLGGYDLIPSLEPDAEVDPGELTMTLVKELKRLEPFGAGNPEPTFVMKNVTVVEKRTVGDNHLKLKISAGGRVFDAIAFRMADSDVSGNLDIAFIPESNSWNGTTTLQLRIKAMRNTEG